MILRALTPTIFNPRTGAAVGAAAAVTHVETTNQFCERMRATVDLARRLRGLPPLQRAKSDDNPLEPNADRAPTSSRLKSHPEYAAAHERAIAMSARHAGWCDGLEAAQASEAPSRRGKAVR